MKTNPIDLKKIFRSVNRCRIKRPLLTLMLALSLQGTGYAQITLKSTGSLESVLFAIRKQSGYDLFYEAKDLKGLKSITLDLQNVSLKEALDKALEGQPLDYRISSNSVTIIPKSNTQEKKAQVAIEGRVVDSKGKPITGASIRLKDGSANVVHTNEKGIFGLPMSADKKRIVISYVGYKTTEAILDASKINMVTMESLQTEVDEVVVTGMMNLNKSTFTGSAATYSGEELKMIGNQNVIQSLRSLDPSFLIMENNIAGSNPNITPTIELRGQSSISTESLRDDFSTDPNQPLFILDGFETNLRSIIDLDMNRIASITILKDAGSTAIYGSRASNGVVVVETLRPAAGKVRLNYTSDLTFEFADLSGYNMMSAAEKLEFERLSGVYEVRDAYDPTLAESYYRPLYSRRLRDVLSGIDSYWLSDPLQNGFSHRHSLYAEGGSENLYFNAGGNYRNQNALMIGSGREDWGARLNFTYRNNKLNINNNILINGAVGEESPYGDFSTWVNTNPYYKKLGADVPYLEYVANYNPPYLGIRVVNPLYNANLQSFDRSKTFGVTNNLQLMYNFDNHLRLTTSLQLRYNTTETNKFKSPLHTDYLQVEDIMRKGDYSFRYRKDFAYTASAMLTYANVFAEKHSVTLNGRTEVADEDNLLKGFNAQGFPSASNGNPAFAYQYTENGTPYSTSGVRRRNSFIATGNYTYDRRYTLEASFNYDGSTAFGSNNMYSPFYSIGAMWNIKNESFLSDNELISNLRLRANYGVNGNQSFASSASLTTYQYNGLFNLNGQGTIVSALGNPDLKWQNTYNTNLGIDASFANNRASITVDAYRKLTDPQVVAVDLPLSTGLSLYPFNAGELEVKGIEATVRFAPIYRPAERFVWNIHAMGSTYTQRYDGFADKLKSLNESLQKSNSLTRFYDGADPADLWAVRSLGIDPGSGREVFLKKDGTQTFEYNAEDLVVVGNSRPSFQGTFGSNLSYQGFTASIIFRYIMDQDVMNTALFNKVENISWNSIVSNNQDKRALYERWKQPGDRAEFKSISISSTTPISSRFVQRENTLSFESISLGYDFRNSRWISNVGLSNLKLTGFMNDIARVSTIRRERGTSYPFARSFSFSLTANFK